MTYDATAAYRVTFSQFWNAGNAALAARGAAEMLYGEARRAWELALEQDWLKDADR